MRRPDTARAKAIRPGKHVTEPHASITRSGLALWCAACGYQPRAIASVPNSPVSHPHVDRGAPGESHPGRRLT
jgi:hypothetical protein